MKVIIPSAKIVSEELTNLGKLPAIIYPLNQEIVFDYIYKQYKEINPEIKIMCYENIDEVKLRLNSYVENFNVEIVELPILKDLAYTIYTAITGNEDSVIINFGDTIVLDNIVDEVEDIIIYSEDYFSDKWTFFDSQNGIINSIYDKVSTISNKEKMKLFVGVFQISNPLFFKNCLKEAFNLKIDQISSFYLAIQMYSEKYKFKEIKTNNWFDIGHADKYYNSQLGVKAREFNHITIDKNRGILKKTSEHKEKFIGEILWYLKLPTDIEYVRPRIFNYSTNYLNSFIEMEYYSYHTVHELFLYSDLEYNQWIEIFEKIKFIYQDFKKYTVKNENIKPALEEMYYLKTIERLENLKNNEKFSTFFENKIIINDIKYLSLNEIIEKLREIVPKMLYDVDKFNIIHGDLCFANIMIDSKLSVIKLIDPRGKFGDFDIYGDTRYELAKLFHSVDGKYDFIIKDLFSINVDTENNTICYRVNDRKRDFDIYELFLRIFAEQIGADCKKIELIEALLFLSMIPLHGESEQHQFAMLATGIEILDRVENVRSI